LAAEQALSRAAYPQAMSLIEAALKLLDKMPEGTERSRAELALRTIEGTVALVCNGGSSNEREYAVRRACELAEKIGEAKQVVRALSSLSGLYFTQGESARGLELARRSLALWDGIQDKGLLADLGYTAGMLASSCGNFREAASHLEAALHHARRANRAVSPQWGLVYRCVIASSLAQVLQYLGRLDEAVKVAEEALRHARESRHMFSLGAVLMLRGDLYQRRRQPDNAREHCEETIALSEENGFVEWLPWGRLIHGWALCELGQAAEGLAEMEAAIAGYLRLVEFRACNILSRFVAKLSPGWAGWRKHLRF